MIGYDELGPLALMRQFATGRLRFNRINQVAVDEHRARSPEELRQMVADHLQPRGLTAGFGGMIALVDGMIHQQDIRRALGIHRAILPQRLLAVLDYALRARRPRRLARRRVRLTATDVDWSYGTGPEVRGPGEALLMAMAGRATCPAGSRRPGKSQAGEEHPRLTARASILRSASKRRTRSSMSSRMGRTASTLCPAGSGRAQST